MIRRILEWLRTMPNPYRDEAMNLFDDDLRSATTGSLFDAIMASIPGLYSA